VSQSDSFIEEVTEEVRRDRVGRLARRYGWIGVVAVLAIVGGAGWNEWNKARNQAAAQALGDGIIAAVALEDPAARAEALAALPVTGPAGQAYLDLIRAAQMQGAGRAQDALVLLDDIATRQGAGPIYRELAAFKAAMLRAPDLPASERLAAFEALATPGRAFRPLALEQVALAHLAAGDTEKAVATLQGLADEPQVSAGLARRSGQLLIALGAAPVRSPGLPALPVGEGD